MPVDAVPDALVRVVRRYQAERRERRAVLQLGPPHPQRELRARRLTGSADGGGGVKRYACARR